MMIMAKDGEVALSFQPEDGGESLIFLGAHEGHVADPLIEAWTAIITMATPPIPSRTIPLQAIMALT